MKRHAFKGTALAAALLVAVAGCEDLGTTGIQTGDATLRVLLTDAPADYIDSAWVDIGRVDLVPAEGEGEGGDSIITLTDDGTDGYINLLDLQGEATAQLAELDIESGVYAQLRLIVDSAKVQLKEGYEFRDGGTMQTLFVPSGAQTGIKLNLEGSNGEGEGTEGGVLIAPGENVLVLDFDVNQSFRMQGNAETPAGIRSFHFQPTIRVAVNDVAASIAGTVSAADDSINIDGLTVTAEPLGDGALEAYQSQTATAQTDSTGAYMIHFVVPGDYAVSVAPDSGFVASPDTTDISVGEAEAVTGIDFDIDEEDDSSS